MNDFVGRVAVITGAASGIGRSLAAAAAGRGMTVVAADIDEPALTDTVAELRASGATALAATVDVTDQASLDQLAETAFDRFGGVHLLCNNAGVFSGGLLWERSTADWDWVMAVNVYGIVHALRSFVPRMLAQADRSHIVNTASMGGLLTNAYSGPYYASKFAAVGLTECLAHDLRSVDANIGVSVLVPSLVATRIGTSERNRTERFVDHVRPEPTPDAAFVTQMLQDSTRAGMTPDDVADCVFGAVERDEFYIPTKPSFHDQIRQRHDAMQTLHLPPSPSID